MGVVHPGVAEKLGEENKKYDVVYNILKQVEPRRKLVLLLTSEGYFLDGYNNEVEAGPTEEDCYDSKGAVGVGNDAIFRGVRAF